MMFEKQCKSGMDLLKGASSTTENPLKELISVVEVEKEADGEPPYVAKSSGETFQPTEEKLEAAKGGVPEAASVGGTSDSPPRKRAKLDE